MQIERILLIKATVIKPEVEGAFPPVGALYIASSILHNRKTEVKVVDTSFKDFQVHNLYKTFQEFRPDLVGISAITPEAESLDAIAEVTRQLLPHATIVAGGPHPTYYTRQVLRSGNVDYVVLGEGEETILELLDALEGKRDIDQVAGIAYRVNGDMIQTPPRPPLLNLDAIPFPAWELIEVERYTRLPTMSVRISHNPYMVIVTSRGCPFKCFYCHDMHGKSFRGRSPENIVEEMTWLKNRFFVNEFEIIDDIFNFDLRRAIKTFDLIIEKQLDVKLRFPNGIRADICTDEFLEKFRQAGGQYTAVAIESASQRLQRLMKKYLNHQKVEKTIAKASELGIFTLGFFMLGFPSETREEIEQTIQWALHSDLDAALFNIVTPYEGTELSTAFKEVLPREEDLSYYHFRFVPVSLCDLSPEELRKRVQRAYTAFYLSRKRLFKKAPRAHKVAQFMNYLAQMFHITFQERKERKELFTSQRRLKQGPAAVS